MSDQTDQPNQATGQTPSEPSQPSASDSFVIPESYKDRGWTDKIKTSDDLWKTLDNAQSLLGKRSAGIPATDAPEEDWQKFYQSSRPASADKYALPDIDGVPENFDLTAFKAPAQKLMFDAGLSQKQAADLWKQYMGAEITASAEREKALDGQYDVALDKMFGDKRAEAERIAQDAIKNILPEDMRGSIAALSQYPDAMASVIKIISEQNAQIEAVKKQYGAEGSLPGSQGGAQGTPIADIASKLSKLRMSAEHKDPFHPQHGKVKQEVSELSQQVQQHYNR